MRATCAIALLLLACGAEAPTATSEWASPGSNAATQSRAHNGTDVNSAPRKIALRFEQSHFLTVQRAADGKLSTHCVHGEALAQQSLVSAPLASAPSSPSASLSVPVLALPSAPSLGPQRSAP